ncbi:MAG TPA: Mu-like prophage major head subunit gpT family protein [Amaricoccus sp.]|uniref:phage major capsid protein n=1 Tax=Amaricoccus sp. TaxID=1872485 RepID=UPI002BA5EE14|nr:Mu-like prophage major head subunit gpT family protein [Amaricoccus sp.]HMQ91513.1 Mu-like prophage major head subunit gpT family protein [Amaricoccus sp.]HMR50932.1 Mu-like prophage major head subunit gpT family protein [Amaricoccus sp.]HMR58897.1 Mu-like prophage major head subunit gpT family protein [Amaricoccus sp.]HMT97889.1 Mu-like prophage major head subunit gpT family protein [Amaricoccus sp.]
MRPEICIRAAGSYDPETRIFSATFSAGSPRAMRDAIGPFLEQVDLAGFDPADLVGRTVFLDHRHTTDSAVGTVIAARREGEAITGEVQLSAADSVADTRTKVAEGVIAAVSIGYRVTRWVEGRDASGRRTKTAAAGELVELSLVGLPADPRAKIRSEAMPLEQNTNEPEASPNPPPVESPAAGSSLPIIRAHAAPTGSEDPAADYRLRDEALACRMSGAEPSDGARQFMGFGFAEHAALALRAAGETSLGVMSREGVLHRAMHGTSDFPALLTGAGNRTLRGAYDVAASPLKMLAQRVTASDFRPQDVLSIGGMGELAEVTENGEITATTTAEAKESWQLKTFGKLFSLTRKALVNDDLGAFGRVTAELGRAAAETENAALAALLLGNPVMGDGKALFHADHGNLADTPAAIGETSISAARLAMRSQTGITGERIAVTPKYLVVGPEIETEAEKFLAAIHPTETDAVNPFSGKITLAVEPRISGDDWFVFAAPGEVPVLLLGHLASAPGPQISSRDGFEVLGREFRVVLDFAVAATDWRGAYRNAGA